MKKTVAFSWTFPLDTLSGGIERVTQRLMDGLSKRGYDCLFIQHDIEKNRFMFKGDDVGDLAGFLNRQNVDILINQNGYSSHVSEALDRLKWQGRYLVCHHSEPMYLRKVYDLRGVLTQVRTHENASGVRLAWLLRLMAYPLWQRSSTREIAKTQNRNYRHADHYIVLSPSFLPQFAKLIRQPVIPKVVSIPNPLSFEINPESVSNFVKKNEVLIVARLNDKEKRISAALKAWRIIEGQDRDNWMLKIVGDGPDVSLLQDMARKLGLKRVEFLGRQDPLPHYETASILLMTSRIEGWGLTLTEAMQTGAVPIAFDAYASLRDIVNDGDTGIIVPNGDIAALGEETLRLMKDPARRRSLAASAHAAAQRYRLDLVLDRWESIL